MFTLLYQLINSVKLYTTKNHLQRKPDLLFPITSFWRIKNPAKKLIIDSS